MLSWVNVMNENQEFLSSEIQLQAATLNDQNLASVSLLVARYMPFYAYSFGLMLEKITDQLRHQTNMCILSNGRIVAYAGWIEVNAQEIQEWYQGTGNLPNPSWSRENPFVVTILVAQDGRFLKYIRRGIARLCQGRRAYAERVGRTTGGCAVRRSKLIKRALQDI
jgi:hypothetical protein